MIAIVAANDLKRISCLYHFTNVANLPKIKEYDGILCTRRLKEAGEAFSAGGDVDSLALDEKYGLDRFVHLCFQMRHPMEYRVRERNPQANLTYLRIDSAVLYEPDVMFSTGIAYGTGVQIITPQEACERGLIDFQVLYQWMNWSDSEVQKKRQAAELCEILVPEYVSMKFIRDFPNG
jgi:hypothetical protein